MTESTPASKDFIMENMVFFLEWSIEYIKAARTDNKPMMEALDSDWKKWQDKNLKGNK